MYKSASGMQLAEATMKAYLLASVSYKDGRAPSELDSTYRDFQKRDASYATMADELRQLQIGDSGTDHPIVIGTAETPPGRTGQGIFSATGSSGVDNKVLQTMIHAEPRAAGARMPPPPRRNLRGVIEAGATPTASEEPSSRAAPRPRSPCARGALDALGP